MLRREFLLLGTLPIISGMLKFPTPKSYDDINHLIVQCIDANILCYDIDAKPGKLSNLLVSLLKCQIYRKFLSYPENDDETYPEDHSIIYLDNKVNKRQIRSIYEDGQREGIIYIPDFNQKIKDYGATTAPDDHHFIILKNEFGFMLGSF